MPRLSYIGQTPVEDPDLASRLQATAILESGSINRSTAASQVNDAAALKAAKTYVDTQDATFALDSYVTARDALNVPNTAVGAVNGVASLDSGTKIPLAQIPAAGAGFLKGPWGPTTVTTGSTTTTPLKIASFNIGVQSLAFRPLVYVSALINVTADGRPILEARISDGTPANYAATTLVATGVGREKFNDQQAVAVVPDGGTGASGSGSYSTSYNTWITLWLFDSFGSSVSLGASGLISAAVFLLRNQQ